MNRTPALSDRQKELIISALRESGDSWLTGHALYTKVVNEGGIETGLKKQNVTAFAATKAKNKRLNNRGKWEFNGLADTFATARLHLSHMLDRKPMLPYAEHDDD